MSVSFTQKMDKNKDGVVTLEEFVIACQEVGGRNDHEFRKAASPQSKIVRNVWEIPIYWGHFCWAELYVSSFL